MNTQKNSKKQIFPDLPREGKAVDENGKFMAGWEQTFHQLYQALQANYRNEGIQIPQVRTDIVNSTLEYYSQFIGKDLPINVADISGRKIFDMDTRQEKVFVITFNPTESRHVESASWKTVTLT